MHAGAAIEPDANFVLAGGFELGDPPFFFVQHALPELAATLAEAVSEPTYATGDRATVAKQLRALRCWRQHTNDEKTSIIRVMVVWKAHLSR